VSWFMSDGGVPVLQDLGVIHLPPHVGVLTRDGGKVLAVSVSFVEEDAGRVSH